MGFERGYKLDCVIWHIDFFKDMEEVVKYAKMDSIPIDKYINAIEFNMTMIVVDLCFLIYLKEYYGNLAFNLNKDIKKRIVSIFDAAPKISRGNEKWRETFINKMYEKLSLNNAEKIYSILNENFNGCFYDTDKNEILLNEIADNFLKNKKEELIKVMASNDTSLLSRYIRSIH